MSDFTPPYRVRTNPGGPGDQPAFPSVIDSSGLQHGEDTVADLFGDSETVKRHAAITVSALNAAICAEEMGYDGVLAVEALPYLLAASKRLHDDLLFRAKMEGATPVVAASDGAWQALCDALAQARKED